MLRVIHYERCMKCDKNNEWLQLRDSSCHFLLMDDFSSSLSLTCSVVMSRHVLVVKLGNANIEIMRLSKHAQRGGVSHE